MTVDFNYDNLNLCIKIAQTEKHYNVYCFQQNERLYFIFERKINFKLFDMYVKNKLIYGAKHREFSKGQK